MGEQIVEAQEKGQKGEIYDESGNPFWTKFIKADYLGETLPKDKTQTLADAQNLKTKVSELLNKEERMKIELDKIRKLDIELNQKTKFQRELQKSKQSKQIEDEKLDNKY